MPKIIEKEKLSHINEEEIIFIKKSTDEIKNKYGSRHSFEWESWNRFIFAYCKDDILVGCCIYYEEQEGGLFISKIYTKQEYRKSGYAKKMINYLKTKNKKIMAGIHPKNTESNNLFSNEGFEDIAIMKEYKG